MRYHRIVRAAGEVSLHQGIAITLRWAALLALGLVLAWRGTRVVTLPALLAIGGVWNGYLTFNWLRGVALRRQEEIALLSDFLLAAALFFFSYTLRGPLAWAGLLPIASAAWALGLPGGVGAALGVIFGFAALSAADIPLAEIPLLMLGPAVFFVGSGVALGFASQEVRLRLKQDADLAGGRREESAHQTDQQVKTLAELATTLNSGLAFEQVLELALDRGINSLTEPNETVSRAVGGILLFDEGGLRVASGRRLTATDLGRVLPGQRGALAKLLVEGEALTISRPTTDPEFSLLAGLQNCQSLRCAPLRFGQDLFGVVFFGHPQENFFTDERGEVVAVVARQVVVAVRQDQFHE